MKHNNDLLDKKLKKKTEAFVKQQIESKHKSKRSEASKVNSSTKNTPVTSNRAQKP